MLGRSGGIEEVAGDNGHVDALGDEAVDDGGDGTLEISAAGVHAAGVHAVAETATEVPVGGEADAQGGSRGGGHDSIIAEEPLWGKHPYHRRATFVARTYARDITPVSVKMFRRRKGAGLSTNWCRRILKPGTRNQGSGRTNPGSEVQ